MQDGLVIRIEYETSPDSSAIQWLPPSQTAGKVHPYLFTQCQAIHARALLPCQDSPSNKVLPCLLTALRSRHVVQCTYSASVTVPAPLVALMSALQVSENPRPDVGGTRQEGKQNTYFFNQPVPMPSYLVAIAVGALEKRDIGPRSAVWSEASMVEKGAHEVSEQPAALFHRASTASQCSCADSSQTPRSSSVLLKTSSAPTCGGDTTSSCCRHRSRTAEWRTPVSLS